MDQQQILDSSPTFQTDFVPPAVSMPEPSIRPMHAWLRRIGYGFTGLLVIAFVIYKAPVLLGLVTSDIPPIDDSDLVPSVRMVPEGDNAYFLVDQLNETVKQVLTGIDMERVNRILQGKEPWDETFASTTLLQAKEVLILYERFSEYPAFQYPELADPSTYSIGTEFTSNTSLRNATKLMLLHATYLLRTGEEERSVEPVAAVLRVSNLLQQPNTFLISHLVGTACRTLVHDYIKMELADPTVSTTTTVALLNAVNDEPSNDSEGLRNALKVEYVFLRNPLVASPSVFSNQELRTVLAMRGVPNWDVEKNPYWLRPNETLLLWAEMIRAPLRQLERGCADGRTEYIPSVSTLPSDRLLLPRLWFTENAIGKMIYETNFNDFFSVVERSCEFKAKEYTLMTGFALRMYAEQYGELPVTLEALADSGLSQVYQDPFAHAPLRYDPAQRLVYSVGKDRVDNGGDSVSDIAITIPRRR